MKITMSEEVH